MGRTPLERLLAVFGPTGQLLHRLAEMDSEMARLAASHDRGGRPSGTT